MIESIGHGVLDTPPSRRMTDYAGVVARMSGARSGTTPTPSRISLRSSALR